MTDDHILDKLETREAVSGQGSGGWEVQGQELAPDEGLFVTLNMTKHTNQMGKEKEKEEERERGE